MFAGNKYVNEEFNLRIGNFVINKVYSLKYLGIIIDEKLLWKAHINYIHNKISSSLGIIRKIKDNLTREGLIIVYYSLVYPYFQYCNHAWGSAKKNCHTTIMVIAKESH